MPIEEYVCWERDPVTVVARLRLATRCVAPAGLPNQSFPISHRLRRHAGASIVKYGQFCRLFPR